MEDNDRYDDDNHEDDYAINENNIHKVYDDEDDNDINDENNHYINV